MTLRRPSAATVLAGAALFVALGGPAEAARTLGLKKDSVTSRAIKNRTISTVDLSASTIRRLMVTPRSSVTGASVADGSLTGVDVAGGSVGGDRIAAGSIAGDRLAANAVTSGTVVDNSLDDIDIASNAISGDEVRDGTLSGADTGRFVGSLQALDFGTINAGECRTVASTSLTSVVPGQDLRDDAIVVTPLVSFPATGVSVTAQAASADQIAVTVCNVSGPNPRNIGARSFRFVSFDTGGN